MLFFFSKKETSRTLPPLSRYKAYEISASSCFRQTILLFSCFASTQHFVLGHTFLKQDRQQMLLSFLMKETLRTLYVLYATQLKRSQPDHFMTDNSFISVLRYHWKPSNFLHLLSQLPNLPFFGTRFHFLHLPYPLIFFLCHLLSKQCLQYSIRVRSTRNPFCFIQQPTRGRERCTLP